MLLTTQQTWSMSVHFANDLLIYEIADVVLVSSNVHL